MTTYTCFPLEVKTGAPPNYTKAVTQARALLAYFTNTILGKDSLAHKLYRALFVRQVLMQIENYKLYNIFEPDYFKPILDRREEWLQGDYTLAKVNNFVEGIVVAHSDAPTCLTANYEVENRVLKITLPSSLLDNLVRSSIDSFDARIDLIAPFNIPSEYLLKNASYKLLVEHLNETDEIEKSDAAAPTVMAGSGEMQQQENDQPSIATDKRTPTNKSVAEPATTTDVKSSPTNLRILLGHNEMGNDPLYWEPTHTGRCLNTNTGIIGTMGTGKTQFTKSLVAQLIQKSTQKCGPTANRHAHF